MPHCRCTTCKLRVRVPGRSTELVEVLCPECGSPLEPVADLSELIGYHTVASRGDRAESVRSGSHQPIGAFLPRRTALRERERDRLEAEQWLDDDDPIAVAVTLPPPQTQL